jgi:hypothetical protein
MTFILTSTPSLFPVCCCPYFTSPSACQSLWPTCSYRCATTTLPVVVLEYSLASRSVQAQALILLPVREYFLYLQAAVLGVLTVLDSVHDGTSTKAISAIWHVGPTSNRAATLRDLKKVRGVRDCALYLQVALLDRLDLIQGDYYDLTSLIVESESGTDTVSEQERRNSSQGNVRQSSKCQAMTLVTAQWWNFWHASPPFRELHRPPLKTSETA